MPNPQKIKCRTVNVIYHSDKVSTVLLEPLSKIPSFKSGQFLHFTLEDYDPTLGFWPESRVFSIASTPRDKLIRITYSVKGKYTERMYKEIRVGREFWIKLPYGHFTVDDDNNSVILVAGGTGITPFIPFLTELIYKQKERQIYLYYGITSKKLFIFEEEILKVKNAYPYIRLNLTCMESDYQLEDLYIEKGIIDKHKILIDALNSSAKIYLSGPPNMISEFKEYFVNKGIVSERIKTDEWE